MIANLNNKPLDCSASNFVAYQLGLIASEVGSLGPSYAGDEIDRGLILIRKLREKGFVVFDTVPSNERR